MATTGWIKARSFSGDGCKDPGMWIRHFLRVVAANGWDDGRSKIAHAAVLFTNDAEQWYTAIAAWAEDGVQATT